MKDRHVVVTGRRRVLTIVAGFGAALLIPGAASARRPGRFEWRGSALGAEARIVLCHRDRARVAEAIGVVVAEIRRLEREFSLHRPDSALSLLNSKGFLRHPSLDMVRVLQEGYRFGELSGGAFDITVQPLWQIYADHFAADPDDETGPPAAAVEGARRLVDYRRLRIAPDRIGLDEGMAITLNGIAQGYVTDRAADLLRSRGWSHVLIDLGELRALGGTAEGRPWSAGLRDPDDGRRLLATIPLLDRAAATSAGAAARFDRLGRHHHLFDPATGQSAHLYRSVTVIADRATVADALSTALSVLPRDAAPDLLRRAGAAEAWFVRLDGGVEHLPC